MRFYKVIYTNLVAFKATRADAHRYGKTFANRAEVEIHEIDVPTDRDTVFQIMVTDPAEMNFKVIKKYELSDRGGLKEIPK